MKKKRIRKIGKHGSKINILEWKLCLNLFNSAFVDNFQTKKDGVVTSHDWKLDEKELASKFTSKTKAIIFNNPNNPVGKVGHVFLTSVKPVDIDRPQGKT